jgi:hypothetical protein
LQEPRTLPELVDTMLASPMAILSATAATTRQIMHTCVHAYVPTADLFSLLDSKEPKKVERSRYRVADGESNWH